MKHYIGIDLGTTNSAICSYDGETVHAHKSPEQTLVTPSAIFYDRRGNKYVGVRAYDNAARYPGNSATLFKRLIGSATPIKLDAVSKTMTAEECSAEVLRTLFGYLPEDVRNDAETGTVITVPAAFSQIQRDATMAAADMAQLGQFALMQEPVAAVMTVMRQRSTDGAFLVFDIGGGTLDVAVAQASGGRVSLLSHGGIAMCGGRDIDRVIFDSIVTPWLIEQFKLPHGFATDPRYIGLARLATWAVEKAKIDLSARPEAVIALAENEIGVRDENGAECYVDVSIQRATLDRLIEPLIDDAIQAARSTLADGGLASQDVDRIVFVGGPTQYQPLRDRVASALGIASSTEVNPMTAVAEGAAVFAESIDWTSKRRGRKSSRGSVSVGRLALAFNYTARTPEPRARVLAALQGSPLDGVSFEINSLDTGWSSGRIALLDGAAIDVPLARPGENAFKVFVFDGAGGPIAFENPRITIARTAATIEAIPASSSIGLEVLDKRGGRPVLDYLVRKGDPLPRKGQIRVQAAESLRGGQAHALNFKFWEGEIQDHISDNEFVGLMTVSGKDVGDNTIAAGSDMVCDYEVLDSGNIVVEVSVPSIKASFTGRNFYSRQRVDFVSASAQVSEDARGVRERVESVASKVCDERLNEARAKIEQVENLESNADPESMKHAADAVLRAKRLLADVRQANRPAIRQLELHGCAEFFATAVKQYARSSEVASFENLLRTAQRAIEKNLSEFEMLLDELRSKNFEILWRQDWFVADQFGRFVSEPWAFANTSQYQELVSAGRLALESDDFVKLRGIVATLHAARFAPADEAEMLALVNVIRG